MAGSLPLMNEVQPVTQLPQSRRQVHDVLSAAESVPPISNSEVTCGPMTRPATLSSSATSSSNSTDFSNSSRRRRRYATRREGPLAAAETCAPFCIFMTFIIIITITSSSSSSSIIIFLLPISLTADSAPCVGTWKVTLSARKVAPCVRWPVYSQAQGCVCTALPLGGDVEQPWLMTSSIKPEVHNVSLRRQRRTEPRPWITCTKIGEARTCSSEDVIADRHTHTDTLITILRSSIGAE